MKEDDVTPADLSTEEVIIYNPTKPPLPENDCLGKYCNPEDKACIGDPNSSDPRMRGLCMCYAECLAMTNERKAASEKSKSTILKAKRSAKEDKINLFLNANIFGLVSKIDVDNGNLVNFYKGELLVASVEPKTKKFFVASLKPFEGSIKTPNNDGFYTGTVDAPVDVVLSIIKSNLL